MGTAEILIVFSALMALIAVVTIGIDWIGKPLKNRRFIPRMYRFEDEKLPVDAYGHTTLSTNEPLLPMIAPVPPMHIQPPPVVVAQVSVSATQHVEHHSNATVQVAATQTSPTQTSPTQTAPARSFAAEIAQDDEAAPVSRSAFSDSLAESEGAHDTADDEAWLSTGLMAHSTIAGTTPTTRSEATSSTSWRPEMPLDTTVDDRKPNLATKAERFWMTTAELASDSHFDDEDIARMASGKAPRRTNPRSGRAEAMQLTGLRQASAHTEVRMRWPDEAVDPWNAS
jgi:hypothetical protein